MYDEKTRESTNGNERKTHVLCDVYGNHHPVHLRFGHGVCLSVWPLRQTNRQSRDFQDAQSGIQHPDRRDDWLPQWYQINGR